MPLLKNTMNYEQEKHKTDNQHKYMGRISNPQLCKDRWPCRQFLYSRDASSQKQLMMWTDLDFNKLYLSSFMDLSYHGKYMKKYRS